MKPKGHSRLLATSATLIVATFATSSLFAASATWNGTTNATWATGTNWSASPAPGAGDTATFNNAGNANTTIDLGAGVSVGNIAFDTADAASYIIGSGGAGVQTLTLGGSGSISMAAAVITNQLIDANLRLGTAAGAEAFTITNNTAAASNTLTLAGGVSTLLSGVKTLTIGGTGVTNVSGAINNGSGTLALNKTGAHVLTLSGASNYSGGTLITGILTAANSSALGTGPVTINASAGDQLQLGNGVNIANPLTISGGGVIGQGIVYVPTGNATYSGTINVSAVQAAGGHFATAGYIDNALTLAGDNTITSAIPVTVRNGTVKITGAQNYTGGTTMNGAAFIQFGKTTSMPATGPVVTLANGVIAVNAGGAGEFTGGTGAGTLGGLTSGIGGQGAPVTWIANTTLGIDTSNAAGTVTHSAAFAPAVAVGLIKLGPGTLELTGGGTYASTGNIVANMPLIIRQGTLLLNGGTHAVTGEIGVGSTFGTAAGAAGYNARLQIDSGALSTTSWLSVCKGNGIGGVSSDLEINNAATVTAANLSGGWNNANTANLPKGSITLNGTASLSVNNNVHLAESAGSNFTVNINGTSTFSQTANANQTTIGMGANSVGLVNVNGGTASFHRDLIVAGNNAGASGKLVLNSGTVHAATTVERWLIINPGNTSSGQIDINGGNLNLNTNTDLRFSTGATAAGTNVVNLAGGSITGHTGNNNGVFSGTSVVDMNYGSTAAVNNTFNLAGGTLTIGQVISSNDAGTVAFNFNGGTLRAAASNPNFVNLGGATQSVNVLVGGAIIDSNGNDVTIVDALQSSGGNGGLTKLGAGNLTLNGTNTYTGATLVSAGTLTLANSGDVNTSSGITVNGSGAKLVQANFQTITTPVTLTQGSLDGNGTINSVTVASSPGNSISAGAGNVGTLNVGTLTFQGEAALNLRATGGALDQSISVTDLTTSASGDIVINATNATSVWANGSYPVVTYSTFNGDISHFSVGTISGLIGSQTATLVNTGTSIDLVIEGEALIWTGIGSANWTTGGTTNWSFEGDPVTFSANSPVIFNDNASTFTVNISAANVSPSAVIFENSNEYTINGPFGIATGSLIHNGTGTVTLATTNTFTGATTINGGVLQLGNGTTDGSIATSSSITVNNGSLIFNLIGNHTYSNPITGTGPITKMGAGALTLSGANTFTGDFTLEAGVLNLNSPGALGAGPGIIILNSGTLDNTSGATVLMTPNKDQAWNADITFLGTNDLFMSNGGVTISAPRTVNVQAGTFGAGAITDFGSGYDLIKTGVGTLVLNGTNNLFAGNLDIQNGIVGTSQDLFAAAPIGTGTLQNSGAVATKWTYWTGNTAVTSNVLIRNNDGSNTFQLGIVKRGTGSLTLTNSSNFATANLSVDSGRLVLNGTGTYGARNDNGATNTGLTATVGNVGGANGELEINGATVNYNNRSNAGTEVWRSSLTIGNNGTGAGAVKFTSGTLTTDKQLALGGVAGASAGYTQTGGTATIGGFLAIGLGTSSGAFNLSGGNFTLTTGPVTNGAGAGSLGVMNLSGNAVYNHNSAAATDATYGAGDAGLWIAENGTGTLNVSGNAALTVPNNGIKVGRNNAATSSGTLNLLGGNVTTNFVTKTGALATGIVNFNGGTLTANIASATFLGGLTSAYVHSGGGTVNNGGNAITITQALLAPTGNGVNVAATASGSGYITTPVVTVTGDGTGATAVANIDDGGNLLGISITNPGVGYTTPPTFALIGGGIGNTGSVTGTATLTANISGGMTFTGAAVTTLAGVNTYTGNTNVNSGSTLLLADNAGLKFAPGANGVSNKVTGAGSAQFFGDFTIDLTGAAIADDNTWTLVDTAGKSFDTATFTVNGFTEIGSTGVHQLVSGNNTWTFTESTGQLKLDVIAGSGYAGWASINANGEESNLDFDKDGMDNGVEYFMGATGSSFTANPSIVTVGSARTITWPKSPAFSGTYLVRTSPNLVNWTTATTGVVDNGTSVVYTLPAGETEIFVRLEVKPN